jgi:hypothetical protein
VLLAPAGESSANIVAGRERAGVDASGKREIGGPKKRVALPELSIRLMGWGSCKMDGFRVRTREEASSRDEDMDTLLACMVRCRGLGDVKGEGVVDGVRDRVVGKVTLDLLALCLGFAADSV